MKRILLLLALAGLALPSAALAKGPSEAVVTGPGLGKKIVITGTESTGSPLMTFVEETGFFPAVFGQQPNPMLPGRPTGNLGPKFKIEYKVPDQDGTKFNLVQDLYPYARPDAVTYTKPGQKVFDMQAPGGWYASAYLKQALVDRGLPKAAPGASNATASAKSAGFFSTTRIGAAFAAALLLGAGLTWLIIRRRPDRHPA